MNDKVRQKFAAISQKAVAAMSDGQFEKAERLFRKAATTKPVFAQGSYNLGHFLRKQGRFRESETWLRKACRLDPTYMAPVLDIALLQISTERMDEAKETLSKLIMEYPDDIDVLRACAQCAFKKGDWSKALDMYRDIQKQSDLSIDDELILIRTLFEARESDEAWRRVYALGQKDRATAPDLVKSISRRSHGGFTLYEDRLMRRLGLSRP